MTTYNKQKQQSKYKLFLETSAIKNIAQFYPELWIQIKIFKSSTQDFENSNWHSSHSSSTCKPLPISDRIEYLDIIQ